LKDAEVVQIVMRDFMSNYERHCLIRRASLQKPPREIDIAARSREGREEREPRNLDNQAILRSPVCLEPSTYSGDLVREEAIPLEYNGLVDLVV
jgi:hypothetical protein